MWVNEGKQELGVLGKLRRNQITSKAGRRGNILGEPEDMGTWSEEQKLLPADTTLPW